MKKFLSLFLLFSVAGCSATCRDHPDIHRLAISPRLSTQYFFDETWNRWLSQSEPVLEKISADRRKFYEKGDFEHVWQIPPQPLIPDGASILDGAWRDKPGAEAYREDIRILVFLVKPDGPAATHVLRNAYSPDIAVYNLGEKRSMLVFILGEGWRSGTYFHILRWSLDGGTLQSVFEAGGEECADMLSYEMSSGSRPKLTIFGIRKEKYRAYQKDVDELAKSLGIEVNLN